MSEVASAHFIPLSSCKEGSSDFSIADTACTLLTVHVPDVRWGDVSIDLGTRLSPKNAVIRSALKLLIGHMKFRCVISDSLIHLYLKPSFTYRCILLPNEPIAEVPLNLAESYHEELPDLRLWGLTLVSKLVLTSACADSERLLVTGHDARSAVSLIFPFVSSN